MLHKNVEIYKTKIVYYNMIYWEEQFLKDILQQEN